jgi:6,7-dimethyl-8-ribityllumazine synthase
MPRIIEGKVSGDGLRFCVVLSRFNEFLSNQLKDGALDTLFRHGVSEGDVDVIKVPGSFELPYVAKKVAEGGKYDSVICLGVIIRGQTPHFDYIASETAKGIAQSALSTGIPVIFGVVTADTLEQAIERCGTKGGNKGRDAAMNALEMVNLYKLL